MFLKTVLGKRPLGTFNYFLRPANRISLCKLSNNPAESKKMAEHESCLGGLPLRTIIQKLEQFAPLSYASSWDNIGLLVDPGFSAANTVKTILLTNDLTEDVVDEAVKLKTGLIISYHPNIFQGMKSISQRTWKERIIVSCIKNNIAVFSPHTSWDAVKGGVNDWLANSFPLEKSAPILLQIPNDPSIGAGRLCTLQEAISIKQAIECIKKRIGIDYLRLALGKNQNQDSKIKTVALCAGSGNSVLNGIDADLYLTGEMLHHDILDATQKGINVILCNHSDSERGFLHCFHQQLEDSILEKKVKVIVSAVDKDPLITV